MEIHLQYPKLQTVAFSNALLKLCHQARTSKADLFLFDLSKTQFISPFGIVLLAGTILECLGEGKRGKYRRPVKQSTRKFLSGIGFNNFIRVPGESQIIESPNVQLKRLDSIDYFLTDKILEVFSFNIQMSDGVKGSLKLSLNELMTNAFDHSESERGCYVCVQSYKRAKKIRLCIADFGIGILASLRKVHTLRGLNSDYESILLAVQELVTSRIGKPAGYGLSHINRFIEINEGKMHILSGEGKVLWDYTGIRKLKGKKQTMHYPFRGTIINLEINADEEGLYFLEEERDYIF